MHACLIGGMQESAEGQLVGAHRLDEKRTREVEEIAKPWREQAVGITVMLLDEVRVETWTA